MAMTERGPVIPEGSQKGYDRFHFAPAYRVGNTLHVSGVIGSGESLDDEFASAFANLASVLDAAGFSLADVVEITSFHINMSETLASFMKARDAAMTAPWPAWTAIGCTELAIPTGRAEVKVTAVKQD